MRTTKQTVITLDDGDEIVIRGADIAVTVRFTATNEEQRCSMTMHTDNVVWMHGKPEGTGDIDNTRDTTLLSEGDCTIDLV